MTDRKLTFSQRYGFAPIEVPVQLDYMSDELRTGLWNVLKPIWDACERGTTATDLGTWLSETLADGFFRWNIDELSHYFYENRRMFREAFFQRLSWVHAYDFIEFLAGLDLPRRDELLANWNKALERDNSGYRLVDGIVTRITDEHEVASVESALHALEPFPNAREHLANAARFLGDRTSPDYGKSIAESLHAIEALCQVLTDNPKAELGAALKVLEERGTLHGALKAAFSALYGYASDAPGIRHGKGFGDERPDQADARFMLITCSAFVNYVVAKQAVA
ncbi:MAG: hypothetical protein KC635_19190 [Myxococcales bacterium]|nr:hypothetical protein [Myxococcales bacterium]